MEIVEPYIARLSGYAGSGDSRALYDGGQVIAFAHCGTVAIAVPLAAALAHSVTLIPRRCMLYLRHAQGAEKDAADRLSGARIGHTMVPVLARLIEERPKAMRLRMLTHGQPYLWVPRIVSERVASWVWRVPPWAILAALPAKAAMLPDPWDEAEMASVSRIVELIKHGESDEQ